MRFKRGTGLRNLKNEARLGGEKWILDEKTNKVYRISVGDAFPTKRVLDFLLPINRIAADATSRMLQKSNLCIVLAEATTIKICNKFQHLLAGYRGSASLVVSSTHSWPLRVKRIATRYSCPQEKSPGKLAAASDMIDCWSIDSRDRFHAGLDIIDFGLDTHE